MQITDVTCHIWLWASHRHRIRPVRLGCWTLADRMDWTTGCLDGWLHTLLLPKPIFLPAYLPHSCVLQVHDLAAVAQRRESHSVQGLGPNGERAGPQSQWVTVSWSMFMVGKNRELETNVLGIVWGRWKAVVSFSQGSKAPAPSQPLATIFYHFAFASPCSRYPAFLSFPDCVWQDLLPLGHFIQASSPSVSPLKRKPTFTTLPAGVLPSPLFTPSTYTAYFPYSTCHHLTCYMCSLAYLLMFCLLQWEANTSQGRDLQFALLNPQHLKGHQAHNTC